MPCRFKNHYPEKWRAERARVRLQEKYRWLLYIYDCSSCGEFHLSRVKVNGKPVPLVGTLAA